MKILKGKWKFDYDQESDVLYAYVNKSRKASCTEECSGIVLRFDIKRKLCGFTIVDFVKRMITMKDAKYDKKLINLIKLWR
jgi:uncharacterized protein YuzE